MGVFVVVCFCFSAAVAVGLVSCWRYVRCDFLARFCARVLSWFGVAETFTPSGHWGNVISGHVHERGPGVSACQGSFLLMACDVNSGHVHECRPHRFGCLVCFFCFFFCFFLSPSRDLLRAFWFEPIFSLSVCLYLSMCVYVCPYLFLSCLSVSVCLPVCLSVCVSYIYILSLSLSDYNNKEDF